MRHAAIGLVLAAALAPASALPGERPSTLAPSSPCAFFRDRAYGKGLDHHATAMLWACEAIAVRRDAGIGLGDRLEAVDGALARYRAAVTAAPRDDEPAIARATGALDALAAIAAGY